MFNLNKKSLKKYLPLLPLIIFLLVMLGYPLVCNIIFSFSEVTFRTVKEPVFIGLENYKEALFSAPFWESFGFSLKFAIAAMSCEVVIGLILAVALEPLLREKKALLTFLLLPLMIAPVLMGIMYRLLLNEFVGIIPQYLALIGIEINLLNPPWIVGTLLLIEILQWTPFALLILFAGLQNVPESLMEAGKIDGASSLGLFRYIILPILTPSIAIAAFIRFVDSFRVFDHIYCHDSNDHLPCAAGDLYEEYCKEIIDEKDTENPIIYTGGFNHQFSLSGDNHDLTEDSVPDLRISPATSFYTHIKELYRCADFILA